MAKSDEKRKTNPPFLNGVPVMLVLKLLSRNEMYGYEIVKAIQKATSEEFVFAEGCIYPILHTLEKDGLVTSREQSTGGRVRLYYRVTPNGLKRLEAMQDEWAKVSRTVDQALRWEPQC
ncbi:MAG: PadR family transcriptional regulator [Syntrophobacteraceae bacterium]